MNKTTSKQVSKIEVNNKSTEKTDNVEITNNENLKDNEMTEQFTKYKELNPEQEEIADWLGNLRFRKQLVGGISEYDVWKKIIELNAMYEEALKAEHIRCDAIIDHHKKTKNIKEVKEEREKIKNE